MEFTPAAEPIAKFPKDFSADHACQVEPLACGLEGMTRVNNCIENRVVVLIAAGSQSTYALQCAQSMGARKIILINRGKRGRLHRPAGHDGRRQVTPLGDRLEPNIARVGKSPPTGNGSAASSATRPMRWPSAGFPVNGTPSRL